MSNDGLPRFPDRLRIGGAYTFMGETWGAILVLDPPRRIKLGKIGIESRPHAPGENYMEYVLEETADGTRMTFTEHWKEGPDHLAFFGDDLPGGPETPFHPGTLAGRHGMFEGLAALLDGARRKPRTEAERSDRHAIYREQIRSKLPAAQPKTGF